MFESARVEVIQDIENTLLPRHSAFEDYAELNYEVQEVYECIRSLGYKGWWEKEKTYIPQRRYKLWTF